MKRKPMDEINVRAKNFFQFVELLDICNSMGYYFKTKHTAFYLYFFNNTFGVSITDFESGNYRMKWLDCEMDDKIDYKEFKNIIYGLI